MSSVYQAVAQPLLGIAELCRFRRAGLARFEYNWHGFWQSWSALPFAAAPFAVNAHMLSLLATGRGAHAISLSQSILVFAAGWLAYVALFLVVARFLLLHRGTLATLLVLNWLRLFKQLVTLPLLALAAGGVLSSGFLAVLYLALGVYLISVEIFILRQALGATLAQAIGFVVLDELTSRLLVHGFQLLLR
ncbi:hypothetical protein [Pedomonas mirosovicensis]|uniref:hypothetical protein n=1 Tax=Pedomonas mirosovicensis TaxID=2908641 RepID=UPI00216A045B|nr:hypothetical protein [Pedomonas mirosovicensis]MCH8684202.1 hypothetical protein [Pedomonas mirosovicensis]